MQIIRLGGAGPQNSVLPANEISPIDELIGAIPDMPGMTLRRYWWQSDRAMLQKLKGNNHPVWYDRQNGAALIGRSTAFPTRGTAFTTTPAYNEEPRETYTVTGSVRMDAVVGPPGPLSAPSDILDLDANTIYLAFRAGAVPDGLYRVFGTAEPIPGETPTDDVMAMGMFNGTLRVLNDAGTANLLSGVSDYRNIPIVVRVSKSGTHGMSLAVNGVQIAHNPLLTSPLISRTFSLFGAGGSPGSNNFQGTIRHLMIFAGADLAKDKFYQSADQLVTQHLMADIGIL